MFEIIKSALLEVSLFEMAFKRKEVINKTLDLSMHIAKHIAKVALFPNHTARSHWEHEIHTACDHIDNYHYDGTKKLKPHEYHDILYNKPFEGTNLLDSVSVKSVRNDCLPDGKWSSYHKAELNIKIKSAYHDLSNQLATENGYNHIATTLKNHNI